MNVGDFLDDTSDGLQSVTPSRLSLADSPNDPAEAAAAESLARSLDLRYPSRAFQVDSGTQAGVSGLGLQRLAFEQAAAQQVMFCWAAKVSISPIHPLPVS